MTKPLRNFLVVVWFVFLYLLPEACEAQRAQGFDQGELEINGRDGSIEPTSSSVTKPNLLFIMTDQQRWDAFGAVQDELLRYKNKLKIRTPNLDRLAEGGVRFRSAYSAGTSCGPARASLRTGTTLQRHGVLVNALLRKKIYTLMNMFQRKIETVTSIDQVLVELKSYVSEYYGKFHLPDAFYYRQRGPDSLSSQDMYWNRSADYWPPGMTRSGAVIRFDDFDFYNETPMFNKLNWRSAYKRELDYFLEKDGMNRSSFTYLSGQQVNPLTSLPYEPIRMDSYYGVTTVARARQTEVYGRNVLSTRYSPTAVLGRIGIQALNRLAHEGRPFVLTLSFNSPHPPMVASPEYLDYYYKQRSMLLVPSTLHDDRKNTAYIKSSKDLDKRSLEVVQGMTAVYYALVEEVDEWVGRLLDELDSLGLANETMVIFTTDHGELLGAHQLYGKAKLYEEAIRVPLIMRFPGEIPSGRVVDEPVSHIDVFSTIMDYLRATYLDNSDGISLRRFIDNESYNRDFDEDIVVVEADNRSPASATRLSGSLGREPNFMIRKGHYKLMLPKNRDSSVLDMMFDLERDPGEENNLLGVKGMTASALTIAKAEHLKALLVEWMRRMDGDEKFYSDNKYNMGEGQGDILEIKNRRTWKTVDQWISDQTLEFGQPVYREGSFLRNEYLYIGRTNPGKLEIKEISVQGRDADYFSLSKFDRFLSPGEYTRVTVAFRSPEPVDFGSLEANLRIQTNVGGVTRIELKGR